MSPIEQGLLITLIGMGLVFIVILLLWLLMDLLVRFTADKVEEEETPEETADVEPMTELPAPAPAIASDIKKRAAAAAVAVALASRRGMTIPVQSAATTAGGWQAAHRSSQLLSKNVRGRTR